LSYECDECGSDDDDDGGVGGGGGGGDNGDDDDNNDDSFRFVAFVSALLITFSEYFPLMSSCLFITCKGLLYLPKSCPVTYTSDVY
jgi:hypothetical protein